MGFPYMLVGYMRVSSDSDRQTTDLQRDALLVAGGLAPHPSEWALLSTETVDGVPQLVYQIPLDEKFSPALAGVEFSRVFDRLIIGPSQYSFPMCEAFAAALAEAGVPQDRQRLFISGIPIRT